MGPVLQKFGFKFSKFERQYISQYLPDRNKTNGNMLLFMRGMRTDSRTISVFYSLLIPKNLRVPDNHSGTEGV